MVNTTPERHFLLENLTCWLSQLLGKNFKIIYLRYLNLCKVNKDRDRISKHKLTILDKNFSFEQTQSPVLVTFMFGATMKIL